MRLASSTGESLRSFAGYVPIDGWKSMLEALAVIEFWDCLR
jgi:hypothetical protein